jgi:hypothetical protein
MSAWTTSWTPAPTTASSWSARCRPTPARYAHRCGVQGTIAQAARRSDLHQARYRGLAKTHLQHVLTALALDLVRVDAWLTGTPLGGSWASRLTRLRPALSPV